MPESCLLEAYAWAITRSDRRGNDALIAGVPGENQHVSDYRKLHVWRKAHALAISVHRDAGQIRGATYTSLRSQLIRSAMSIPANIVEGRNQGSEKDFGRFLRYALGSACELESHLAMARDIGVIPNKTFTPLAIEVSAVRKMLTGLLKAIAKKPPQQEGKEVKS